MDYNAFCELVKERCKLDIYEEDINLPDKDKRAYLTAKFDWFKEGNTRYFDNICNVMGQLYPSYQWVDDIEAVEGDNAVFQVFSKALAAEIWPVSYGGDLA